MPKDFRVEVRIRNNRILEALEATGQTRKEFCEMWGFSTNVLSAYVTMRESPVGSAGWKGQAVRLAEALGYLPEEVFPESVRQVQKTVAQLKMSKEDVDCMMRLSGRQIAQKALPEVAESAEMQKAVKMVLCKLTPREEKVIRMRFGIGEAHEHSLDEVGEVFETSRERTRQIEAKALRKLRHPSRAKWLVEYFDEDRAEAMLMRERETRLDDIRRRAEEPEDRWGRW